MNTKIRAIQWSAATSIFEWFDFFLYVSLMPVLSKLFLAGMSTEKQYIFALLTFGVGFLARPVGGLFFGYLCDRYGRKSTLLINMMLMGASTYMFSILPSYDSIGMIAPIFLIGIRIVQGIALGGSYPSIITYVGEMAEKGKVSRATSYIPISPGLGFGLSAIAVYMLNSYFTASEVAEYAWRFPFVTSMVLLSFSVWMRLQMDESPVFTKMVKEKQVSSNPIVEVFFNAGNFKKMAIVAFIMLAHSSLWYTGFTYTSSYLAQLMKVKASDVQLVMFIASVLTLPIYPIVGALGDVISKRKIIFFTTVITIIATLPVYRLVTEIANPELVASQAANEVVIKTRSAHFCSPQFNLTNVTVLSTGCDIAKNILYKNAVNYDVIYDPTIEDKTRIIIGKEVFDVTAIDSKKSDDLKDNVKVNEKRLEAFLQKVKYENKSNLTSGAFFLLTTVITIYIGLIASMYATTSALFVELFDSRVRATAISVGYNVGVGVLSGFVAPASLSLITITGSIYLGPLFAVITSSVALALAFLLLRTVK